MTETTSDHEIKCIRSGSIGGNTHWTLCHNFSNSGCPCMDNIHMSDGGVKLFHPPTPFTAYLASSDSATTRYARSLAYVYTTSIHLILTWIICILTVKIPLKWSSLSTTRTQLLRLAAISCEASMTSKFSLTVSAWVGRKADTVPAIFFVCRTRDVLVCFLDNSCSSFLRIAYNNNKKRQLNGTIQAKTMNKWVPRHVSIGVVYFQD